MFQLQASTGSSTRQMNAPAHTTTLPSLTGLRWIAAFFVFGFHLFVVSYFQGTGRDVMAVLFGAGDTGVSLFFVLSGFVLAWSDVPGGSVAVFWRRRLARIWPLHLTGVALACIVSFTFVPGIRTKSPMAVLANVFLVSDWRSDWWQAGNPASWSLVCEAFFYLVFPGFIRVLRMLPQQWLVVVGASAVIATAIAPTLASDLPGHLSAYSFPLLRLPEFILGMAVAVLMRSGAWRGASLKLAVPVVVLSYIGALLTVFSPYGVTGAASLSFALLISALARSDMEGRTGFVGAKLMVRLGELSFSFYLVHLLVIASVSSPWPGGHPNLQARGAIPLAVLALIVSLGLAWFLNRFVEIPCRSFVMKVTMLRRDVPRSSNLNPSSLYARSPERANVPK